MTEWEKMISGRLYNAEVPELQAMRRRAAELCWRLEQLPPAREADRSALLRELLGAVKDTCTVNPGFRCDYGSNITVGSSFYANYNCVILDCAPVVFGDHVFIAPNCGFYTAGHPLDPPTRNSGLEFARPITVEDDVWIGGNVTVLPGVTIGRGSVIGAGSVVSRDIPCSVVAVGNPCRPVREIQ
ncbi:sugar O-acetyltransferase [uncultured Flavonifractor sp.]|uniref:sugar O-acetyltransferase n=1 Tax=uncultured Flavonifractor sp. TaxID=1193534 RepID=UPI002616D178|nr:sugar O-acetyltransferase [uncultured Flavonifractor sp.]